MWIGKHLATGIVLAAALVAGGSAQAKGPQGAGPGAMPSHSAAPSSQGIGSNDWAQQTPGWSKAQDSQGWDGATSPPGWDHNPIGQDHGWDNTSAPPGLERR
jgi:hypothetical protein